MLGRAVTEVYFRVNDIELLRPRSDYLGFGADRFWEHHAQQPLGLLSTLWGPLWLVVAAVAVLRIVRRGQDPAAARGWLVLAAMAVAGLVPVLVTLDETRVYAMLTAPVLVGAAVLLDRERPALPPRWIPAAAAGLLAVTALVPGGFTTGVTSWRTQLPQGEIARVPGLRGASRRPDGVAVGPVRLRHPPAVSAASRPSRWSAVAGSSN